MDNIGGYILLDHDKLLSKIQSADPLNPSVITESEFDEIYSKLLSGKEIQIRRPDGSISPVGSYQTDVLLDVAQSATLEFNVSYGDGGVENYQYNFAKIIDETDPDAPVVSCFGIVAVRLTTVPLPDMTDAGKMLGVDDDGNYAFVSGGGGENSPDLVIKCNGLFSATKSMYTIESGSVANVANILDNGGNPNIVIYARNRKSAEPGSVERYENGLVTLAMRDSDTEMTIYFMVNQSNSSIAIGELYFYNNVLNNVRINTIYAI